MKRSQWIRAYPPVKGLNKSVNPLLLTLNDLSNADDIFYSTDLERAQRPGQGAFTVSSEINSQSSPQVTFLNDFWYRSGSAQTQRVVKYSANFVEADTGGDGVFANITGPTALTINDRVTGDNLANRLILGFENAVPQTSTGGALSDLGGSPPNGSIIRKHINRLFISGIDATPHDIFFSNAFQPTVWSGRGTGSLSVDPDDSDPVGVTALFPSFRGEEYVGKRNSLYQITGNNPFNYQIIPITSGIGAIEHNAVCQIQNDMLFVSDRGIHSLVATLQGKVADTDLLSFPVRKLWEDEINLNQSKRFWLRYIRSLNSILFLYPAGNSTYCTHALGLNLYTGGWFRWPNVNISSIAEIVDSNRRIVLVGRNDGIVAELDDRFYSDIGGE